MHSTLVIATRNQGKAREFTEMLAPKGITIKTLADYPDVGVIKETGSTFEENATIKAKAIADHTQLPVLADDSGLEVTALNGEPGIYSARYAGDHDDAANNAKLLANLKTVPADKRQAVFHTTLVLLKPNGAKLVVNGEVQGQILTVPRGENGFGYDPLFYVPSKGKTMAEMGEDEKNAISHRGRATKKMMTQFDNWWEA
ncbi:XTP/dITP diphosphatase [Secundilactobacillus hailunensis]|uniref:dITP/XTP pyrophosphatase n=1 Tax=Secundilactobacillus hailunensis TaxID=2559923 RepID=A0ABW1TBJ7_9LACO|nr:XTP/dITP diphosphatase [Secundilactobacillus hailunensis]